MEKLKRLFGKLGSLGALAMQHLKLLVQADQATVDVALVQADQATVDVALVQADQATVDVALVQADQATVDVALVQADQATVDVALVTKEEVLQLAAKALTPAYQLSGQHRQFVVDQIITMPVEEKNIIDDNYGKLKGRW
jgi:hypothetical protein